MTAVVGIGLLFSLCGCRRDKIRTHRVRKPAAVSGPALTGQALADDLTWTVPADWNEMSAADSSLRAASYRIGAGESAVRVTVTALRGAAGGVDANVNRWRRQLNLPAVSGQQLRPATWSVRTPVGVATVVDVGGPAAPAAGQGILAAILPAGNRTWFIKIAAPQQWIASRGKEVLAAFLKTFRRRRAAP